MSSAPVQPDPPPKPKPPKAKKKHWVLRILVSLVVILFLIAAVVQVVLWTDLPRGIVVQQIEGQLGLRLSVKSLTTGWLGHTQLNDVTIGLPLSDKAFLDVPVLKVKNTSLFGLIIGRPVEVEAIELDQPHLYVVQDSAGQWNLQQVAELLARAGGKKSGEESAATSSTPQMPRVHLTGGIVSIIDNQNRTLDIQPLSVEGYSDTAVSWKYDVQVPSKLGITGRLVPGGNWEHEVAVKVADIGDWAQPWNKQFPKVAIDVNWNGALTATGIGGRLDIHKATVVTPSGNAEAYGAVSIQTGSNGVSLRPEKLLLKTGIKIVPNITLVSGLISFDPAAKVVKSDQLLVSVFGGAVKVGANYDLNTSAADVEVAWNQLALGTDINHSGGLRVTMRKPFPDKVVIDGHLTSVGNRGPGQWLASANFNASGKSFKDLNWTVNADKLQWQRHVQGFNFDGLSLAGALRDDSVTLTSISLPNKDLISGTAGYSLTGNQVWEAHFQGQRWPFKPMPGTELGFVLNASGDKTRIVVETFTLKSPDVVINANGDYTFGNPKPLRVKMSIVNAPPRDIPVALASSTEAKIFNGTIDGHFSAEGTLEPLQMDLRGELNGREFDFRGHHVGDIHLDLAKQSHIDANGFYVYAEALSLFGGKWGLDGVYIPDWNDLIVNIDMKDVALKDLATFAGQENITGTLDGQLHVTVRGLNFAPDHIVVPPASFTLKNINVDGVLIDKLDATLWMELGHCEMNPIHFTHAEGTGDVRVAMDLHDFRKIDVKTKITNWPIDLEGAQVHMNASVDIPDALIELPNPKAFDPAMQKLRVTAPQIGFTGTTTLKGKNVGELVAYAGFNGRELDVRGVHMKLFGGRLDGQAHAVLDSPLTSTAEFTWQDLDMKQLALIFPQLNEMSGTFVGGLRVAPTNVPRAREPLALVITTQLQNGAWRTLPIKDLRLAAYFGPNEPEFGGGWRVVMEDGSLDPSVLHLGGGTINLWGRAAFGGRATSSQSQITFRELDLNQFVHAMEPGADQMPGRVAGSIMLIRAPLPAPPGTISLERMFPGRTPPVITPIAVAGPHDPPLKRLFEPIYGEGHVELTHTNLADFKPFAALYALRSLGKDVHKPIGTGNVQFHLEKSALSIESLRYFNRGTEIRAVGNVTDIWKGINAPVDTTITLAAQPLSGTRLPFISDLNEAFNAIQKSLNLAAVRVGGTLDKYHIHQVGLDQMGKQMRTLLVNDAKGAN